VAAVPSSRRNWWISVGGGPGSSRGVPSGDVAWASSGTGAVPPPVPVLRRDVEVVGRGVHRVARRHDAGGADRCAVAVHVDRSDPGEAQAGEVGRRRHGLARQHLRHRAEPAVGVLVEPARQPVLHGGVLDDLLVAFQCAVLVETELVRLHEWEALIERRGDHEPCHTVERAGGDHAALQVRTAQQVGARRIAHVEQRHDRVGCATQLDVTTTRRPPSSSSWCAPCGSSGSATTSASATDTIRRPSVLAT
jgi:hypothetical protein